MEKSTDPSSSTSKLGKTFHRLRQNLTRTRNKATSRKREIEVFRQVFDLLDLPFYEIETDFKTMSDGDDTLDFLEGEFPDAGFDRMAISLNKTYDIREFIYAEKLQKTTVWKLFLRFLQTSGETTAAVLFKVSRKGYWILTNRSIAMEPLKPCIIVQARGAAPPVYITALENMRRL